MLRPLGEDGDAAALDFYKRALLRAGRARGEEDGVLRQPPEAEPDDADGGATAVLVHAGLLLSVDEFDALATQTAKYYGLLDVLLVLVLHALPLLLVAALLDERLLLLLLLLLVGACSTIELITFFGLRHGVFRDVSIGQHVGEANNVEGVDARLRLRCLCDERGQAEVRVRKVRSSLSLLSTW